jgi:hypothetical protein
MRSPPKLILRIRSSLDKVQVRERREERKSGREEERLGVFFE